MDVRREYSKIYPYKVWEMVMKRQEVEYPIFLIWVPICLMQNLNFPERHTLRWSSAAKICGASENKQGRAPLSVYSIY